jgi:hypothetical protein
VRKQSGRQSEEQSWRRSGIIEDTKAGDKVNWRLSETIGRQVGDSWETMFQGSQNPASLYARKEKPKYHPQLRD